VESRRPARATWREVAIVAAWFGYPVTLTVPWNTNGVPVGSQPWKKPDGSGPTNPTWLTPLFPLVTVNSTEVLFTSRFASIGGCAS